MKFFILFFSFLTLSLSAFAATGGKGGNSIGLTAGIAAVTQSDINGIATATNATTGRNATQPGSGLEFSAYYQYRFSGSMFALMFRPSYFSQSGKGSTDTYSFTGLTFFPYLKFYPLENNFIHFFMEVGFGYGSLSGKIQQSTGSVNFSGSVFGPAAGLGAEFCFTPTHCMFVEGQLRYMPIPRNLVDSTSGSVDKVSTPTAGQELEYNNSDVGTSLSGIIGSVGYQMNF